MLKQLNDLSPAGWIHENTDRIETREDHWKGNFISHCVPKVFAAYGKIFHPIYEDLSISDHSLSWDDVKETIPDPTDPISKLLGDSTAVYGGNFDPSALRPLRWKDLAKQLGLTFHAEFNDESFTRAFKGRSWPRYLIGPDEGILEDDLCMRIIETLTPFTESKRCFFLYDLIATDDYEGDRLFEGSLEDVLAARQVDGVHASPTRWWPEDRSWIVHTDYDLTFTLFGGSTAMVDALVGNPALECLWANLSDRIDYLADQINVPA